MNTTNGSGVGCEIPRPDGRLCDIPPIGRCATCERAFCLTHQGRTSTGFTYVDRCAPCVAKEEAEEARRRDEERAPYTYFKSGAARDALRLARVPAVKVYETSVKARNEFFRLLLGSEYAHVTTFIGYGWLLGKFPWTYNVGTHGGYPDTKSSLTVLLDTVEHGKNAGVVPVHRFWLGYELLYGSLGDWRMSHREDSPQWREVMQAVKQLVGESS